MQNVDYTPANFLIVAYSSRPVALQRAENFEDGSLSREEGLVILVSKQLSAEKEALLVKLYNSSVLKKHYLWCYSVFGKFGDKFLTLS